MVTKLLSALILAAAGLHIRAEYQGPRFQIYLFKPLATMLLILLALQIETPIAAFYKYAIVAGLVFSLAGDVFLMLPADRFVAGLVSFLLAHCCYIVAFSSRTGFQFSLVWLLPFLIIGAMVLAVLSPGLGKMKLPVAAYTAVILVMAWQALMQWIESSATGALLAFLGASLFVISDSTLAINRFRKQHAGGRALTLSTYYAAQWLIVLSTSAEKAL